MIVEEIEMKLDPELLNAYNKARKITQGLLSTTPEDYKLFFFLDSSLYDSVLLQTQATGSPKAVISANELQLLQQLKKDDLTPNGIDLFYASRSPRIFLPRKSYGTEFSNKVLELKLVHSFAKAALVEQTKSKFPDTLQQLYRNDAIISDLFANNVFEFAKERSAPWIWQYFQDFTAVTRLLSLYNLDDFYIPPTSIRSASIFYNYLLEIKVIMKKRSKAVVKAPLYDLVLNGFAEMVLDEHISTLDKNVQEAVLPYLKGNLGQPLGVIGKRFIQERGENLSDVFEEVIKLKNDHELVKIWSRGETKEELEKVRENLTLRSINWHSSRNSYWSDLWPLRASVYDKVSSTYVGKIQRRGYKSFSELLDDSPLVSSHGRVILKDREVGVFSIQEETVAQEQLLILRNHLQAKKDTFSTPLPGLPDVIVFKKYAGMHVASYLGIADKNQEKKYPLSPYDLPLIVRAIQVTRKKDAYQSEEREEETKISSVNYDNLEKLTEPQHRAIRYLIRQGEVVQ